MATASQIITDGLRLFGCIDITEDAQPSDIASGIRVLNNILRSEHADAAASYLMVTEQCVLPQGVPGQIYSFSIGVANPNYAVQRDIVGVSQIWLNDISLTVNRETRQAPKADVVRTTYPGIITKWHQERQADGSVLVYGWQSPRAPATALIEMGARMPLLVSGDDTVPMPPEGVHDATLLFGQTVCQSYGRTLDSVGLVAQKAAAVNLAWRQRARGMQWMRFVRS